MSGMVRLVVVLVGLGVWAGGFQPASAQYFGRNKVQYDEFDFQRFKTNHFEIYFYEEEREAVMDAGRMADRWYERHRHTYVREFNERKPIIFYANDADFHQTNAISGALGEGTGGVTESIKERVIMPLTGLYRETDHVLGHELVHSFQYDIGLSREDSVRFALELMPLWLVEGTAEYLSVGREDVHTAMWLRDAILNDDLPTLEDMTRKPYEYFPYRYGQAYMAYVGGKYGDVAVANLFKLGGRIGLDSAFVYTLGITADSLSKEWQQVITDHYTPLMEGRTHPAEVGRPVLDKHRSGSELNVAPVISPDGKYIAYLSERDLFTINLFIADAETGKVIRRLKETTSDAHFDAIRFINSAGSWSPDGQQFAFITFVQGDNEIAILDWNSGDITRRIAVEGVSAMSNPAWSPDGKTLAFSGMDGGISDLYLLDLETNAVRQLTDDRYGDLQPSWSPDGKTLAFMTDRGPEGTDFETLRFADTRIGLIDVETGAVDIVRPFQKGDHSNPQFAPDGESVYFLGSPDGFRDIYRYELASGDVYQVTKLKTGVTGIASYSSAMSVAAQSGRLVFSIFDDGNYSVHSFEAEEAVGTVYDPEGRDFTAGILPPDIGSQGLVSNYLDDPFTGLPEMDAFEVEDYNARLQLDYVAPPSVGVSAGGPFGTGVVGGVAFYFSDMLGDHNLVVAASANGTIRDIGGQAIYYNQKRRLNFGAAIGHIPIVYQSFAQGFVGNDLVTDYYRYRIYIDQLELLGSYPLTTTQRLEFNSGFTRYGFDYEVERYISSPNGNFDRDRIDLESPDPLYFYQIGGALVGDYSNNGFTSPIQGGRYRFGVSPRIGEENYVQILADYRRYLFFRPFTLALRGMHIGNYGASQGPSDPADLRGRFTQEYLGYANSFTFVRGYSFTSADFSVECRNPAERCYIDNLIGTRVGLVSAEFRVPLFGTEALGLINFPYLPTELSVFADAGLAWTGEDELSFQLDGKGNQLFGLLDTGAREIVSSIGVTSRFNLFGYMVLEIFYAHPYQRSEKGAHFGFQLVPGW